MQAEISWVKSGLIQDYREADNLSHFVFENGRYQPEYYY